MVSQFDNKKEAAKNGLLEQAFRLAYFILANKDAAELIASEAVIRLSVAVAAQDRRYYYEPHSQHVRARGIRTKITLSELHLLQRLVYDEAESYERAQEQAAISDDRLLVHFIKHLVRITLKRNSFYVTLGLSRLLYHYSTAEAMELYSLVVQNPSRVKDDYYWRSRKGHLMQEMKDRFGALLAVTRAARGEERFVARADSSRYASFVTDCLQVLMPWHTRCPLPAGEGAVAGAIPALDFHGADPDEEHQVEIARIHAVLHAACFERLLAGLKLAAPATRLELPQFFLSEMHNQNNQMQNSNSLSAEIKQPDLQLMRARLDAQKKLRRRAPRRVRILVDRQEHAALDLNGDDRASFYLAEGAEFIEVCAATAEGGARLALYPIDYCRLQRARDAMEFVIELASGHKLAFAITPQRDEYGDVMGAAVLVNYAAVGWRAWRSALGSLSLSPATTLRYGLAGALLVISLTGGWWLWQTLRSDSSGLIATSQTPETVSSPAPSATAVPLTPSPPTAPVDKSTPDSASPRPIVRGASPPRLRDAAADAQGVVQSLAQSKQIFIAINDASPLAQPLRAQLSERLQATQRWTTASREDADTALNVTVAADARTISVQVVNAEGRVLWPRRGRWRAYGGTPEHAAARIVADLLAAAQRVAR